MSNLLFLREPDCFADCVLTHCFTWRDDFNAELGVKHIKETRHHLGATATTSSEKPRKQERDNQTRTCAHPSNLSSARPDYPIRVCLSYFLIIGIGVL